MKPAKNHQLEKARATLEGILKGVPGVTLQWDPYPNQLNPEAAKLVDFTVQINHSNYSHTVAVAFKEHGFPQQLQLAIDQLIRYRYKAERHDALMVAAPYITEEGARLLRNDKISYFDLAGNCHLALGLLYVERTGIPNPFQKNPLAAPALYGMRGERILRVLLTDPKKPWKVAPLAKLTGVSLGTVSIIRKFLLGRDWAKDGPDGILLTQPEKLLRDWAQVWGRRAFKPHGYFSRLPLAETEKKLADFAKTQNRALALTGAAAAWRYAPMTRYQRTQVYWDGETEELALLMEWKKTDSGANVHVLTPRDRGIFDGLQMLDGVPVVCPVQAFLDLQRDPARGEEAAEHLWQTRLFNA